MKIFKYCCAAMALAYLAAALLPTQLIVAQHTGAGAIEPDWIGRAIFAADFLLLGTVFYGLQKREPIYWRLIPVLLVIYLLNMFILPLWSLIRLSLPWLPFMFVGAFFFIGAVFFMAWWRNQKCYFRQ